MPYIRLLRISQWTKNLFLFIPKFFAGNLFKPEDYPVLIFGFFGFSLAASGLYILNDLRDLKTDLKHPKKRFRPLASGKANPAIAVALMIFMLGGGGVIAFILDGPFFICICIYVAMNLAYSFGLKNIAIVDLFIVALGFLIRIYAGGFISHTPVSNWLSVMILLLALFLVVAKRRDDILIMEKDKDFVRETCNSYNLEFVNSCLTIFSAVILVAYIMYTISPEATTRFNSQYLFVTTIFVLAGIMRYLQITYVEQNSGSPSQLLLRDKFIAFSIIGWILSFYIIIYVS